MHVWRRLFRVRPRLVAYVAVALQRFAFSECSLECLGGEVDLASPRADVDRRLAADRVVVLGPDLVELLASLKKYRADSLDTPILLWLRCYPLHGLFMAVVVRPLEAVRFVPIAAILTGPLQDREVAATRGFSAGILVPLTAIFSGPLQDLEVTAVRRIGAGPFVPRAAILTGPLQDREVTTSRREGAGPAAPLAAALSKSFGNA